MVNGESCRRTISMRDTFAEAVHHVLPMYSNPYGALHGGMALNWILTSATMSAMRASRRPTVVARLDHTFFINPVLVGENAIIYSWIDYIGRSSLEATVIMEAEDPSTGERRLTTISYVVLVAVDENLRPVPVETCLSPSNELERELYLSAVERRKRREREISNRRRMPKDLEPLKPLDPEYYIVSYRYAYPEDAVFHNAFFAGKLMYYMDELAGILGTRYSRGAVVTAAVDATNFYAPIRIGNSIEMAAALTYIGRSSMEITIKVIARDDVKGERLHTTTSYFTVVAVDENGRPRRVRPFEPREEWQRELFLQAIQRKKLRERLLRELKEKGSEFAPLKQLHELQGYRGPSS
jgi:acyl-CoA hydrolase